MAVESGKWKVESRTLKVERGKRKKEKETRKGEVGSGEMIEKEDVFKSKEEKSRNFRINDDSVKLKRKEK